MSDPNAPLNKSPFSDKELEHFENLLLEERNQTKEEIEKIDERLEEQHALEDDRISSHDHHPGDLGSEEEEKETAFLLKKKQRDKLDKIDAALKRIANNTYGVCEETGKKIRKERLEVIPYARYSVEASRTDSPDNPGPLGQTPS
ncbi:TraR/DksA family transcriptional regulator [Fodinibius sediminis]|uniref:Transcriptional regulator, TraR/DksA family n=1 Tax=Fodinibius sediminis TaxID=1214077 RepID=A0A521BDL3_9BACT|nr:TraR/DksA C4-type zinc finger protein [Fodinibius sediminis]SMO45153.1 transcriptional regulator, TraR/DksA family [Fodinibius sediminis]